MVSSSIRRPRDEIGGAVNHAPDSFFVAASNRAEDMGSEEALSKRDERQDWTLGESQALWWLASEPWEVVHCCHNSKLGVLPSGVMTGWMK